MAMQILTYPQNKNAQKALVAAQFVGVEIEEPPFEWGVTKKSEEFKKHTPIGKVPVLVTPKGTVFESNAIARYVARLNNHKGGLLGADEWEQGQVDQWIDFASNELGTPLMSWAGPVTGWGEYKEEAISKVRATAERGLAALEAALTSSSTELRLVGDHLTLADIIVVCELVVPWQCVLAPEVMAPYPTVTKYFTTLVKLPQFHKVLGDVEQAPKVPSGPLPDEENPFKKKTAKREKESGEEDKDAKKAKTDGA